MGYGACYCLWREEYVVLRATTTGLAVYMTSQRLSHQHPASSFSPSAYTLTLPLAVSALARSGPGFLSPSLESDSRLATILLSASDFSLSGLSGFLGTASVNLLSPSIARAAGPPPKSRFGL